MGAGASAASALPPRVYTFKEQKGSWPLEYTHKQTTKSKHTEARVGVCNSDRSNLDMLGSPFYRMLSAAALREKPSQMRHMDSHLACDVQGGQPLASEHPRSAQSLSGGPPGAEPQPIRRSSQKPSRAIMTIPRNHLKNPQGLEEGSLCGQVLPEPLSPSRICFLPPFLCVSSLSGSESCLAHRRFSGPV